MAFQNHFHVQGSRQSLPSYGQNMPEDPQRISEDFSRRESWTQWTDHFGHTYSRYRSGTEGLKWCIPSKIEEVSRYITFDGRQQSVSFKKTAIPRYRTIQSPSQGYSLNHASNFHTSAAAPRTLHGYPAAGNTHPYESHPKQLSRFYLKVPPCGSSGQMNRPPEENLRSYPFGRTSSAQVRYQSAAFAGSSVSQHPVRGNNFYDERNCKDFHQLAIRQIYTINDLRRHPIFTEYNRLEQLTGLMSARGTDKLCQFEIIAFLKYVNTPVNDISELLVKLENSGFSSAQKPAINQILRSFVGVIGVYKHLKNEDFIDNNASIISLLTNLESTADDKRAQQSILFAATSLFPIKQTELEHYLSQPKILLLRLIQDTPNALVYINYHSNMMYQLGIESEEDGTYESLASRYGHNVRCDNQDCTSFKLAYAADITTEYLFAYQSARKMSVNCESCNKTAFSFDTTLKKVDPLYRQIYMFHCKDHQYDVCLACAQNKVSARKNEKPVTAEPRGAKSFNPALSGRRFTTTEPSSQDKPLSSYLHSQSKSDRHLREAKLTISALKRVAYDLPDGNPLKQYLDLIMTVKRALDDDSETLLINLLVYSYVTETDFYKSVELPAGQQDLPSTAIKNFELDGVEVTLSRWRVTSRLAWFFARQYEGIKILRSNRLVPEENLNNWVKMATGKAGDQCDCVTGLLARIGDVLCDQFLFYRKHEQGSLTMFERIRMFESCFTTDAEQTLNTLKRNRDIPARLTSGFTLTTIAERAESLGITGLSEDKIDCDMCAQTIFTLDYKNQKVKLGLTKSPVLASQLTSGVFGQDYCVNCLQDKYAPVSDFHQSPPKSEDNDYQISAEPLPASPKETRHTLTVDIKPKAEKTAEPNTENAENSKPQMPATNNIKSSDSEKLKNCQICLNKFDDKNHQLVVLLPCAHAHYCYTCIDIWQKRKSECPTCRSHICSFVRVFT